MNEFEIKRQNFVKPFQGDKVQSELIPKIAAELFERQFGVNIQDPEHTVPIVVSTCWKHILKFAKSQPSAEFATDICGLSLEYVTEYSESDKPTNIIPQLVYKSTPIFVEREHNTISATSIDNDIIAGYNEWRSTYMNEVLDKVEQDTECEVRTNYGICLMHSIAVMPMVAAAYAAGIQIAENTHETVNMYSLYEIDVFEEDSSRHITPLAAIKQGLKDDGKRN